jgi:hypothetical protein
MKACTFQVLEREEGQEARAAGWMHVAGVDLKPTHSLRAGAHFEGAGEDRIKAVTRTNKADPR